MKKVFLVAAALIFSGMFTFCNAQDVKVNINNQDATVKDDCPYRINGVCSSEDIGGVDVEFFGEGNLENATHITSVKAWIRLTNYNSFPVNVLWAVTSPNNNEYHKTGATVLGVQGVKEIFIDYGPYSFLSLEGLIVRKLAE